MTEPRRRVPVLPIPAADDGPWRLAKEAAAKRHGQGPVAVWLAAVVYLGMDGGTMRLGAPSHTIRDHALALLAGGDAAPPLAYDIAVSIGYAPKKEIVENDRTRS